MAVFAILGLALVLAVQQTGSPLAPEGGDHPASHATDYDPAEDAPNTARIHLPPGEPTSARTGTLPPETQPRFEIAGVVHDEFGTPLAEVQVAALPVEAAALSGTRFRALRTGLTRADGTFRLELDSATRGLSDSVWVRAWRDLPDGDLEHAVTCRTGPREDLSIMFATRAHPSRALVGHITIAGGDRRFSGRWLLLDDGSRFRYASGQLEESTADIAESTLTIPRHLVRGDVRLRVYGSRDEPLAEANFSSLGEFERSARATIEIPVASRTIRLPDVAPGAACEHVQIGFAQSDGVVQSSAWLPTVSTAAGQSPSLRFWCGAGDYLIGGQDASRQLSAVSRVRLGDNPEVVQLRWQIASPGRHRLTIDVVCPQEAWQQVTYLANVSWLDPEGEAAPVRVWTRPVGPESPRVVFDGLPAGTYRAGLVHRGNPDFVLALQHVRIPECAGVELFPGRLTRLILDPVTRSIWQHAEVVLIPHGRPDVSTHHVLDVHDIRSQVIVGWTPGGTRIIGRTDAGDHWDEDVWVDDHEQAQIIRIGTSSGEARSGLLHDPAATSVARSRSGGPSPVPWERCTLGEDGRFSITMPVGAPAPPLVARDAQGSWNPVPEGGVSWR
jgi:hypothetical protein